MRSQQTRLRHKRSHMPCNLVNFIFGEPGIGGLAGTAVGGGEDETGKKRSEVAKTSAGKEKKCGGGEEISYHHHGFDDVQRCPFGSVSVQVWRPWRGWSPAARWQGGEQEGNEEHVLPFYRGICACAEHVHIRAVPAMRAARLDKSVLARPRASLCASAFLQVVVAVSFQRPARDDNGNVETKPVCSYLLHHPVARHCCLCGSVGGGGGLEIENERE